MHTRTRVFTEESRIFLAYRSADRTIRRRSDRNYAVCVAGVSGVGVRKWHVHAWCLPGRSSNRRQANVSISRVRGHCSFNAPQDTYCEPRGREKGEEGKRFVAPLCDVNSPRVSVGCGGKGTLNFPAVSQAYSSGIFTVNARCYMCHERVTDFRAGK